MAKTTAKWSEQTMAGHVVAWLEDQHWEVYQEVRLKTRGHRRRAIADIIAVRGPIAWAIECKRSLTFEVVAQAAQWQTLRRSIAVPALSRQPARGGGRRRMGGGPAGFTDGPAGRSGGVGIGAPETAGTAGPATSSFSSSVESGSGRRGRALALQVCRSSYVGVLEVGRTGRVYERVTAPIVRAFRSATRDVRGRLHEGHKTHARAGSAAGGYWTPYRQTMEEVRFFVSANPGCTLAEIFRGLTAHHYVSDISAKSSLARALRDWETWCYADESRVPTRYYPLMEDAVVEAGIEVQAETDAESDPDPAPKSVNSAGRSRAGNRRKRKKNTRGDSVLLPSHLPGFLFD